MAAKKTTPKKVTPKAEPVVSAPVAEPKAEKKPAPKVDKGAIVKDLKQWMNDTFHFSLNITPEVNENAAKGIIRALQTSVNLEPTGTLSDADREVLASTKNENVDKIKAALVKIERTDIIA